MSRWVLLVFLAATDCRVSLDTPAPGHHALDTVHLRVDPPADDAGAIDPVVHLRLESATRLDSAEFVLVAGELTEVQLRYLKAGKLTRAVEERSIPFLSWEWEGGLVLAPSRPLPAGIVSLARLETAWIHTLVVAVEPMRRVSRIFPPSDVECSLPSLVYCAQTQLSTSEQFQFYPDGPFGVLRPLEGACLHFEPGAEVSAWSGKLAPPSRVWFGQEAWALDPTPFAGSQREILATAEPTCALDEHAIGPGCWQIQDDRIVERNAGDSRFWIIQLERVDGSKVGEEYWVSEPGNVHELRGFEASTQYVVHGASVDLAGTITRFSSHFTTEMPRDHLVINEVLANPLGPEPGQEWIEIFNDGTSSADLSLYTIADSAGMVELPAWILPAGRFGLIVAEEYDLAEGSDPSPGLDCQLGRVSELGKNGLSNAGERLTLLRGDVAVATSPSQPKPPAGKSLSRNADGTFVVSPPTPCAPNVAADG